MDVTDKSKPLIVSTFQPGINYAGVSVINNAAFGLTEGTITSIGISNVNSPVLIDNKAMSWPGSWSGVAIDSYNNNIFAIGSQGTPMDNIKLVDATNPSSMILSGTAKAGSMQDWGNLKYDNGNLFVASGINGLYIIFTTFTPTPLTPTPTPTPIKSSDLNSDGVVNSVDFGILMSFWNSTAKPKADINQDGIVNSVDFGIMMSGWG